MLIIFSVVKIDPTNSLRKYPNFSGSTSTPAPSSSPPRKSPTPTFRKSPTPTFRKSPTPTFRKSPTPTFRKSPTPTFRKSPTPTFSIQGNCCPQDPCGNCDLCRPALQKQQQQQNRPRPPSPTEPHPDEVKALNFSRTPEQTNNFQPSPSPSPSPPPSAKNREATPLRQTSKNVGISLIPPLPVFSSIPEISTVPGLASMVAIPAVSTLPGIPTLPALPTALSREAAPMHLVQTQTAKKPKLDTGKSNNQVQKDVQFNENGGFSRVFFIQRNVTYQYELFNIIKMSSFLSIKAVSIICLIFSICKPFTTWFSHRQIPNPEFF